MVSGHTWKDYWFYWDGESFREYGGVKITEKQLRNCEGAAAILDAIKAEGESINDIFYRGNGIININHSYTVEPGNVYYYHTTLQLEDAKAMKVETDETGGIYRAALIPDIATYSDLPAIFAD